MRASWLAACAAVALIATGLPAAAAESAAPPVVATESGLVRGATNDGARTFDGIPYAAPPKGALRWKAPRPAARWDGVRDATKPGSPCPQGDFEVPGGSTDEDCLSLNVTTPAAKSAKKRPVVVWIHGGGFITGAGSLYPAKRLARDGDVVVVTINYRLGVFGNLAYPGLKGSGTFGLQDQLAALSWVRRNARAFGGDPRNVTVAGESAGSFSVCGLLTSPLARGAFDKAVMQSGNCLVEWTKNTFSPGVPTISAYLPLELAETFGPEAATKLRCADVDCLRTKDLKALMALDLPFNAPSYGTPVLPIEPREALKAGKFHRVPLLSGGTRDEQSWFVSLADQQSPITEQVYGELLSDSFGEHADEVAARYPASDYVTPALAWSAVATDRAWSCPTIEGNRLLAKRTRTYAFEFADRTATPVLPFPPGFPPGAAHASELPFLFDLVPLTTPAHQELSAQLIGYWSNFAKHGSPNGRDLPRWKRFPYALSLEPGPRHADLAERHNCDLWRSIP